VEAQGTDEAEAENDLGWERRLSRRETVFWYGLAGVSYCVASLFQKSLLNWFVGPLWLVAVVWFGPLLTDHLRGRRDRRGDDRREEAEGPGAR
jgi:hypothetical protein